ncbi:hypothetical protein JXA85_02360 [Candidatus Woesearchaeota archaeon]|nr:hypothetical protein [Candidatus Woesearchaeota archaeon]
MTTILLTGTPGMKKIGVMKKTNKISRKKYQKPIKCVSLSELVDTEAKRLWGKQTDIVDLGLPLQQSLRSYAITEACRRFKGEKNKHMMLSAPMTMYLGGIIPNIIFRSGDIAKLNKDIGIDVVVTLIDDSVTLAKRLGNGHYNTSPGELLKWMAIEADATSANLPYRLGRGGELTYKPHLIIPREYSHLNLAKLLNDDCAPVTYCGFPITHLKIRDDDDANMIKMKKQANRRIDEFVKKQHNYSVVIKPLRLSDSQVESPEEKKHRVYIDKNWFVAKSDLMIAFFPVNCSSKGVFDELKHAKSLGKTTVVIHPNYTSGKEVFGFEPTLSYRDEEQFFAAVNNSWKPEYDDRPERILRRFLSDSNIPRYNLITNNP